MTALKPIENRRVIGVASETYPINKVCGHPECTLPTESTHHIFPRSLTKSKSFFVQITSENSEEQGLTDIILPHAIGLCGSGTTGHHGDLEEHRAWIKLEVDTYIWYDRQQKGDETMLADGDEWIEVGALNPQPGGTGSPKKKGKKHGEPKRNRAQWSVTVPNDERERGADTLDEYEVTSREMLNEAGLLQDDTPRFNVLVYVWAFFLQNFNPKQAKKEQK